MIIASKISFFEGHISKYQLDNIVNMVSSLDLDINHEKYKYSDLKKIYVYG